MTGDAPSPAEPRCFSRWLTLLLVFLTLLAVATLLLPDHVFAFAGLRSEELVQPVTARETLREAVAVIAATTAVGCGLPLALFGAYGTLRKPVFLLAAILAALVVHTFALARIDYTPDQAFTNFVYAQNLAGHGQLAFNLGERAAGYSSLLLVLLLAPFTFIAEASALPAVARGLALAASVPTLVLLYVLARRLSPDRPRVWSLAAPFLLSLYPGYLWCTATGIETQLVTFLVTLGAVLYLLHPSGRGGWWWPLALALAALARTDALVFLAATAAYDLVASRREHRPLGPLLLRLVPALVLLGARGLWAAASHGGVLSSAFVAAGGFSLSPSRLGRGAYYVGSFLAQLGGVTLFVVPLSVALRGFTRPLGYGCVLVAAGLLSVACMGGDPLPAHRLAAVVAPIVFFLLQEGGIAVYEKGIRDADRGASPVNVVLAVAFVLAYPLPYARREMGVRREMAALADRGQAATRLARYVARDRGASVAIFGGGQVKWVSGAPVIDLSGRCDGAIAERGADAAADVLARKPDYIALTARPPEADGASASATAGAPLWPIEARIEQAKAFRQEYAYVKSFAFETAGTHQLVLFKRTARPQLEKDTGDGGGEE